MFSKTNGENKNRPQAMAQPTTANKPAPPSLISHDVSIIGDINSDGEVQIDGKVEGDIRTKSLQIGEKASIKGEIIADKVRVNGTINGRIKARSVELYKTARVIGDIMHEDLSIETGAFLEGHCKRTVKNEDSKEIQDTTEKKKR